MKEYCQEYWKLYDIYTELIDAKARIDPKAIERAKAAIEKHKRECRDCK